MLLTACKIDYMVVYQKVRSVSEAPSAQRGLLLLLKLFWIYRTKGICLWVNQEYVGGNKEEKKAAVKNEKKEEENS